MSDTAFRFIAMLRRIPRYGRGTITAQQMRRKLEDSGISVDIRTVQRDLRTLADQYNLYEDDAARDHGWSYNRDAPAVLTPEMPAGEALALLLAEQHLEPLLPGSVLEELHPQFAAARIVLGRPEFRSLFDWRERVAVLSSGFQLQRPTIPPLVFETIQRGLLERRCLLATYQGVNAKRPKPTTLHPAALLVRLPAVYLIASANDHTSTVMYALHRFRSVELADSPAIDPPGFRLSDYIAEGHHDWIVGPKIRLVLSVDKGFAQILEETPIAKGQVLDPPSQRRQRLVVTVQDSNALRTWLRGHSDVIRVVSPRNLLD